MENVALDGQPNETVVDEELVIIEKIEINVITDLAKPTVNVC
jgi:hypothetical protein